MAEKVRKYYYEGRYRTPEEIAALESLKEKSYRDFASLMARIGALGIGTNLLLNNLPFAEIAAKGTKTLYHGTPYASLIMSGPTPGLRLQYAGRMGRLNVYLMRDTAVQKITDALAKHMKMKPDDALVAAASIVARASENASGRGDYAGALLDEIARWAKSTGNEQIAKEFGDPQKLRKMFSERGLRIYSGINLPNILWWATPGNEIDIAMRRSGNIRMKRSPAYEVLNVITGGLPDAIYHDIRENLQMKGFKREVFRGSPEKIGKDIDKLLKSYSGTRKPLYPVIEFVAGREQLKTLKPFADFPGMTLAANLMSGLKRTVGHLLPTYAPGNDISFAADVPIENIRRVHVVSPAEKKIFVFENLAFKKPEALGVGKRVAKFLPYAGYAGAGAGLLYWAITGKNPISQIYGAIKKRKRSKGLTKKAGLSVTQRIALSKALKTGVLLGIPAALVAYPGALFVREYFIKPKSPADILGAQIAKGVGVAAITPTVLRPFVAFGYSTGQNLGAVSESGPPIVGRPVLVGMMKRYPRTPSTKEVYLKYSLPGALALTGMASYGAYQAYRHYPYHLYQLQRIARKFNQMMNELEVPGLSKFKRMSIAKQFAIGLGAGAGVYGLMSYLLSKVPSIKKKVRIIGSSFTEQYPYAKDPRYIKMKRFYDLYPEKIPQKFKKKRDFLDRISELVAFSLLE